MIGRGGSGGGRGLCVELGSGSLPVVVSPSLFFITDKGLDL
jgi:hypothetical protein